MGVNEASVNVSKRTWQCWCLYYTFNIGVLVTTIEAPKAFLPFFNHLRFFQELRYNVSARTHLRKKIIDPHKNVHFLHTLYRYTGRNSEKNSVLSYKNGNFFLKMFFFSLKSVNYSPIWEQNAHFEKKNPNFAVYSP